MTTLTTRDRRGHRIRTRTLGLPDTAATARAVMVTAYDTYAKAILVANAHHNAWRRLQRRHGDDDPRVKGALTKATNAALYRADAKAKYHVAKLAARVVAA